MSELKVIDGNDITINDNALSVVEYKGIRVISSYDIARLHGKEVRAVNQQFERNKKHLKQGVDYFLINKEEMAESQIVIQKFIPNNVKDLKLFTERGYLKLVKSFTDDLSWKVQDLLVESYFKLKEIALSAKQNYLLDILAAEDELSRAVAMNKYEIGYVRPLENDVKRMQPKEDFYDSVTQSESMLDVGQASKVLNYEGLGRNNLYKYLRDKKILNSKNIPYQQYLNSGYCKLVETSWVDPETQQLAILVKVVFFQKGIDWLDKRLAKEGYTKRKTEYVDED